MPGSGPVPARFRSAVSAAVLAAVLIAAAAPQLASGGPDDGPSATAATAAVDTSVTALDTSTPAGLGELEAVAVAVADELRAVPADEDDQVCATEDLAVSWDAPDGYTHGAHLAPIGPAPDPATTTVNGVVVCGTSTWAFMGFDAVRTDEGWEVTPTPYVEESHDHGPPNLDADGVHGEVPDADADAIDAQPMSTTPSPTAPTATVDSSAWLAGLGPIEGYASHQPQTTCAPDAEPGTVVLRDTLLGAHPVTRNLGISRACHIGGRSEHKEGRAFDWGADVHQPLERQAVDRFFTQLFATDADGNQHALARRLGVMYVIWDGQMWSASRAAEGWRPYRGPSPHTDHVHISLSWDGARGTTSFHTRNLARAGVLGSLPPGPSTPPAPELAPSPTAPAADVPAADEVVPANDRPRRRLADRDSVFDVPSPVHRAPQADHDEDGPRREVLDRRRRAAEERERTRDELERYGEDLRREVERSQRERDERDERDEREGRGGR